MLMHQAIRIHDTLSHALDQARVGSKTGFEKKMTQMFKAESDIFHTFFTTYGAASSTKRPCLHLCLK